MPSPLQLPSLTQFGLLTSLLLLTANASLPLVDFQRMGKVALAGSFAGLDLFHDSSSPSFTFDPSTSTLLLRDPNGALSRIGSTSSSGRILATCTLGSTVYVAGNFTGINDTPASNIASYDNNSGKFEALGTSGPNGPVEALYCDQSTSKVWVGGQFTSPASAVAVWDSASSSWSKPPFNGLSGGQARVASITPDSSKSNLLFTGSFVVSFGGNGTSNNGTHNPNVPFSAGGSPFSSSLVPIPLQDADIDASPSTGDSQFSDIKNVLCPSGDDGPGSSWYARDGSVALVTLRTFSFLEARGVRIGNTFQSDHSTTAFSITTIPDNAIRTLTYVDPSTGQNQTCSTSCPLSTDKSILYQDFLFDGPLTITGVQVKLSEWSGSSSGLHILQLLSSGAFASSLDDQNQQSCYAPSGSGTDHTGSWTEKDVSTDIPGTQQKILVSSVDKGTPSGSAPSFTWYPYVSASGEYEVNFLVPGCVGFQDCDARTTVKVQVFPGDTDSPVTQEVDQRKEQDTVVTIYRGLVVPTSPDFRMTVTMMLADNPTGNGQNGKYTLVADRVQLSLLSPSTSSDGSTSSGQGNNGANRVRSFGILEWPLSNTGDATSSLPNSSLTPFDAAGVGLAGGATGSLTTSNEAVIHTLVQYDSNTLFLGGRFNYTADPKTSNVLMLQDGKISALPDGGLNSEVTSLALVGDKLFVGGSFVDTAAGTQGGQLRGVAVYDIAQRTWASLQGGVDGTVSKLVASDDQVYLVGNFTQVLYAGPSALGTSAAGLAVWDINSSSWINSAGFVSGDLTMVSPAPEASSQFIAGNIRAFSEFGASGLVLLENGNDDDAIEVKPMKLSLGDTPSISASTKQRRAHVRRGPAAWLSHVSLPRLLSRQTLSPSSTLNDSVSPAPAVISGAFWTNTSSSHEVIIIGGNFSVPANQGSASGVAIYDPSAPSLTALVDGQINGVVRSILVVNNKLYLGGQFTMSNSQVNGFAVYDLVAQAWDVPSDLLQGSAVTVRSLTQSASAPNMIIVAGSFDKAGSLQCKGICSFDTTSQEWRALGGGINGDIVSVSYAGENQGLLIVGGSADIGHVLQYNFADSSWSNMGDLPGPVTALEVNDGNSSSIFAAGRSSSDQSFFLSFWDGSSWNAQPHQLEAGSSCSQLAMVPLQDTHSSNGVIQSDRVLMLSGSLLDSNFGSASAILYDGQSLIPYIASSSLLGTAGAISSLFHSFNVFSFSKRRFLATGIVILISIAIAAGVVFLIALIGIVWTLWSRNEDKANLSRDMDSDADDDSIRHRPSSLLEHINAATRGAIVGASSTSPYGDYREDKDEEQDRANRYPPQQQDPFSMEAAGFESPEGAMVVTEDMRRPAHARYSFDGAGEGELALSAGSEVEVLDDRDHAWWYARDPRTGKEGVVPAAYLY